MSPSLYVPGVHPAGSPKDVKAMEAVAIPCWLFRLRAFGMRLPPTVPQPTQGSLVCIDRQEEGRFDMWFHVGASWARPHGEMTSAKLVKESGGVWQFTGTEMNTDVKRQYQQTWLCTPDEATGRAILARMPWPPT